MDFYAVLGLNKDCTVPELRNAYKKLALKWHPDRCSPLGNPNCLQEANNKFQSVHQAYSVLSDANKRFLYDIGMYEDHDDDNDQTGMGEFLNEMVDMMSKNKSNASQDDGNETFEELQELFEEMFASDIDAFNSYDPATPSTCSSTSQASSREPYSISNKRDSSEMISANLRPEAATQFEGFCMGTGGTSSKHRTGESSNRKYATRKCQR